MDLAAALATFFEESSDLLVQMEQILLRAEAGEPEEDDIPALFRCAHTIKGAAGVFGLQAVVSFTHEVESLLDRLRHGEIGFSAELTALLLECRDQITALVAAAAAGELAPVADAALLARLRTWQHNSAGLVDTAPLAQPSADVAVESSGGGQIGNDHWHLSLRFAPDILRFGLAPLVMLRYLGSMGEIVHVETISEALPPLTEADAEQCWLGFEVALRSTASKAQLEDVFEYVQDGAQIRILPPQSRIDEYIALLEGVSADKLRLGEMLIACGTLTRKELLEALAMQMQAEPAPRLGEVLLDQGMVQAPVVEAALNQQKKNEEKRASEARSIKVPADRLDDLIDQVGELVIAGAATELQAKRSLQPQLREAASNLLRLVENVRDTALRLRMLPIGEVFSRFPRVVRDLAHELGRDVELLISGAEAELDKSMVEKIGDPLMHLIRNAIDHGIESPDERLAAGKSARGHVSLNAYHESGSIVIEVSDDGRGLDRQRIRSKAIERGLVAADAHVSDEDIDRLILEPGFSTADHISNISGRGVGMDVVKSNIEALRGSLDIESRPGQGCTIRLCLPLTMAIIDGFQVGVGHSIFILPLDAVVECIELPRGSDAADYLNLRGKVLPFLRLRQMFDVGGRVPERQNIIVVRFAGRMAGIAVDRLLGECQAVIKPLGRLFANLAGIAGSTILGSGEVALILDVAQLVGQAGGEARLGRSRTA